MTPGGAGTEMLLEAGNLTSEEASPTRGEEQSSSPFETPPTGSTGRGGEVGTWNNFNKDTTSSMNSRPVRSDRARPGRYLDKEMGKQVETPAPAAPRPRKRTDSACSSKASLAAIKVKVKPPAALNMPRTKQQQDKASVLCYLLTRVEKVSILHAFGRSCALLIHCFRWTPNFVSHTEVRWYAQSGGFVFQRASGPHRATIRGGCALALLCLFWACRVQRRQDASHALQWAQPWSVRAIHRRMPSQNLQNARVSFCMCCHSDVCTSLFKIFAFNFLHVLPFYCVRESVFMFLRMDAHACVRACTCACVLMGVTKSICSIPHTGFSTFLFIQLRLQYAVVTRHYGAERNSASTHEHMRTYACAQSLSSEP